MAQILRFKDSDASKDLFQSMIDDLDLSESDLKLKHAIDNVNDYTLCGVAYGDYLDAKDFKTGRVTCEACIDKINYCKSYMKGKDY